MTENRVVGVDFSGARRPGESIWITDGHLRDGALAVEACRSAREAFGERERASVLAALVEHVEGAAVTGFDFPFGLPRTVVEELGGPGKWRETVAWVGERFAGADEFAERCQAAARTATDGDRTYLQRTTDGPVGAKSPYHFFTFRQAYHGIRDVLGPLLERGVGVEPMVGGESTTVVEAYPAGTLREMGLPDERYKEETAAARSTRERILSWVTHGGEDYPTVSLADPDRRAVHSDAGGDALDSLIAAVAAARALANGFAVDGDRYDSLEGYVYV